jgi:uncharacterized protein YndB with AHSA1/START domain
MPTSHTLKFTRTINAPPLEVSRLFTHATALRDWLCNAAQCEARAGGRLYLWWDDGYAVTGTFTKFEPGVRLTFAWSSPLDPGPTQVSVTFRAKGDATQVTVTHGGFGGGPKWKSAVAALRAAWPQSLENLGSVAETGVDLRFARRPRLGIGFDEFNAEKAKSLGVPAKAGVLITGTAEGTGARAAGLQKDDVLISLNGKKLAGFGSFGPALHGLKAGDRPKVVFYRGAQKHTVPLELSRWPIPEVPASGKALAEHMRHTNAEVQAGLAALVEGLSEAQAERRPAPNEWSVKELLAHFILTERDYQSWAADMVNDRAVNDDLEMRPNVNERITAVVQRFGSVAALRAELAAAAAETADFIEGLPAHFVQHRRHLYRRAALWQIEYTPIHFSEEHSEQLRQTIAAAKGAN